MFPRRLTAIVWVMMASISAPSLAAQSTPLPLKERPAKKVERKPIPTKKINNRKKKPPKPPPQPAAPELGRGDRPFLSPDELFPLAVEYHTRIETMFVQVRGLVAEAQKRSDPVRLNCLMDKLFQLQNHKLLAGSAMNRFNAALIQKDVDSSFRNFTVVANAHQGSIHFAEAAAACPSKADLQGPNSLLVTDNPVPEAETEQFPNAVIPPALVFPVPERPPGASPII